MDVLSADPPALAGALRRRAEDAGGRVVVGIAGPPGVGKSTVAEAIAAELGSQAALLPLDGFHLSAGVTAELGRAQRRGAPDTFDVDGYLHLLRRVRDQARDGTPSVLYAPAYRREIGEPVAAAVAIPAAARIVLTEGNYLLLDRPGWSQVRPLLDLCWYLEDDHDARIARLVARHVRHGKTPEVAARWVADSDEANARLIAEGRSGATAVLRVGG